MKARSGMTLASNKYQYSSKRCDTETNESGIDIDSLDGGFKKQLKII
jgi:hypothetical protein